MKDSPKDSPKKPVLTKITIRKLDRIETTQLCRDNHN